MSEQGSINPLDIDHILIKVLSYSPVNSLLNCRLVNQTWNSEAMPWIRQKKPIVRVREFSSFPKLCADFEKCDLLPFSTLQLPGKNLENVLQFFIQHGSSVESLTLMDTVLNLENRMALGTIFKCVPNLKALCMQGINRNGYTPGTRFIELNEAIQLTQVEYLRILEASIQLHQEFLDQIFGLFPNLKIAHLILYRDSDQYFQLVAQAMQNLSLTSIITRFYGVPYSSFWEHIAGSQKLKELNCLELISRPSHYLGLVTAQEDFLRSQSESLEVLTLYNQKTRKYNNSYEHALLQFPVMNNLSILELGFTYGGMTVDVKDIPLLVPIEPNQVPRLHFLRNVPPLAIPLFLADSPFTSVQEVELYRSGYHTNCDGLPEIGSRFPNLKKLSHLWTDLNATDMGQIVSYLRDIEELELIVSDFGHPDPEGIRVDFSAFIGGITMDQLQTLIELADPVRRQAVLSWIDTPGPSLRDLKRLTKLKIHFSSQEPNFFFEIDEIGVYLTLLRLSSQLNLTLTGHFAISSDLASKLMAHFKNIYLTPSEQWDGSASGLCAFLKAAHGLVIV